jgi:hypothetical protein
MIRLKRAEWVVLVFTLIYVAGFTVYYLMTENAEFTLYIGVVVAAGIAVGTTLRRTNFDALVLWGLSGWGFIHLLGGSPMINGQSLYSLRIVEIIDRTGDFYVLKMDQVIHFYGFAVAAIMFFQLVWPRLGPPRSIAFAIFIAALASVGAGALNELVEFVAFISFEKTGVGDIYNTGLDLVFNTIGAIVGASVAALTRSDRRSARQPPANATGMVNRREIR